MLRKRWGRHKRYSENGLKALLKQHTEKSNTTDCILWTRAKQRRSGYGVIRAMGQHWLAHRLFWTLFRGQIPAGKCVLHRCDCRPCVNLNHLFVGTHTDNMRDMESKGRGRHPAGEDHGRAKVSWADVKLIRKLHASGVSQRALARRFPIARSSIRRIVDGTGWISPHVSR